MSKFRDMCLQEDLSGGSPLPIVAGAERRQPDLQLAPSGWVYVAIAQERTEGGQFPDVTQGRIPVPGANVVPVGGGEGVTLVFGESEPGCLEGGDEVDFP